MSTLYRATVVRVDSEGVFVEVPELGEGGEWGPLELLGIPLVTGDDVLVGSINDIVDDMVLLGKLVLEPPDPPVEYTPPSNSSFILNYENEAARTAAGLTLVSGLATWLDDEQRLDVYTDEGTPGWVQVYGVKGSTLIYPSGTSIGVGVGIPTSSVDIARAASTDMILQGHVTNDANRRFTVSAAGEISWGPGTAGLDTYLRRQNTQGMRLNPRLAIGLNPDALSVFAVQTALGTARAIYAKATASGGVPVVLIEALNDASRALGILATGDTVERFMVNADGDLEWGPGNAARDTYVVRSATGTLRVDPNLEVANDLTVLGNAYADLFSADTIRASGNDLGRGLWASVSDTVASTATSGTTEKVLLSTPSTTWKAGRAYKIMWDQRFSSTASLASIPAIIFRKTGLGGQQLSDFGREQLPSGSSTYHLSGSTIFTVGASDVTAVVAQTILPNVAANLVQQASAGFPRSFYVYDIGPASAYPNWTVLV